MTEEERRRGIEMVLDHRPAIDLGELQALLAKAGVEVDASTLVEDLDALGYDVDDEPVDDDEEPDAEDEELEDDGEDEVAFVDLAKPVGDVELDEVEDVAPDDDDGARPGRGLGTMVVLGAAAVVLLVILVVVLVSGDGDDDGADDLAVTVPEDTRVAQAGGDTTAPGTTAPPRIAPEGPGSDPALDVPETVTDDFERVDIGDFPGMATWELLSGDWANTDGNLEVLDVPEDGLAVAAFAVDSGDVRAQVQVDRPAARAGIAFRIVDEANLYLWAPVPEIGSIILYEVVDGEATPVADAGFVEPGDGMPALGINLIGDRAELLRDGVVVSTYDSLAPAEDPTRIGVAVLDGGEGLPLFDEYRVLTP
ncbi:MAG TPA: hypothetical protein VGO60_08070 [Iamia sp.]|nr:hypothetical protein [Iamia sp.]